MRGVIAIATALLVLVTAFAPHVHEGVYGKSACAACVTAASEAAARETPAMAPLAAAPAGVLEVAEAQPDAGFPLGAVPGQSPPVA